jgi:hypothetical protein
LKKLISNKTLISLLLSILICSFFIVDQADAFVQGFGEALNVGETLGGGPSTGAAVEAMGSPLKAAGVGIGGIVTDAIRWCLVQILIFVGWLLPVASSIFTYIADAKNITNILEADALYAGWGVVRDTLNIAFILVLIFTAFSTIFHIEKYNYKKMLLTLVLMALLVNFSWPIIRFIIDVSNTLMYTIIKALLGDYSNAEGLSGIFTNLAKESQLKEILAPKAADLENKDISFLIAAIVFVFILAATLLTFSILLVVRIIALAILIVFSPIAFVGSIFPTSGNPAGKFWDYLFKYSFFGPIMMFVLYLAVTLMKEMGTGDGGMIKMQEYAQKQTVVLDVNLIAAMAYYVIPITILWLGMGTAQKMSILGAGAMSGLQNKLQGWGSGMGKKFSGYNWAKKNYDDYKKERGARKEEARWKAGKNFGNKVNDWQDIAMSKLGSSGSAKRLEKRKIAKNKEDIKNEADKHDSTTASVLLGDLNLAIVTPPSDKQGRIAAAAKAKAATAKGKEFEKELESDLKTKATGVVGPPPPPITVPPLTTGMNQVDIARRNDAIRQNAENKRDYEKKIKDEVDKMKSKFFEDLRITIKAGEMA